MNEKQLLNFIRTGSLHDLVIAAGCGDLAKISCLCDYKQRELIRLFYSRVPSQGERFLLLNAICGQCATQEKPPMNSTSNPPTGNLLDEDSGPVTQPDVLNEVCRLAGAKPEDLYSLWTNIGSISRPKLTGREVGQLSWCGLLATYILSRMGRPVYWDLGCCIRTEGSARIQIGTVGRTDEKSILQRYDVLVDPAHFGHHVLLTDWDAVHGTIVEGNTPSIACWSATAADILKKYDGWIVKRVVL